MSSANLSKLCISIAITIISLCVLNACESPSPQKQIVEYSVKHDIGDDDDESGLGGTGKLADNGLGGTGKADEDESGIGGTGIADNGLGGTGRQSDEDGLGGTGIVGTITKFGSIWVNNAHVKFNKTTKITENQIATTGAAFKIGQVVSILSHENSESYQASSIDIVYEVVGPISLIKLSNSTIEVLKQAIKFDKETIVFNTVSSQAAAPDDLRTQQWIKVSGLRDKSGRIFASRIDIIEPPQEVQVIGKLQSIDGNLYRIYDQVIEFDASLSLPSRRNRMLITGRLQQDRIIANSMSVDSTEWVLERAEEILLEGFIYPSDLDDIINIGGIELELPDDFDSFMFNGDSINDMPIQIFGTMEDGDYFEVDDIYFYEYDWNDHPNDVEDYYEDNYYEHNYHEHNYHEHND